MALRAKIANSLKSDDSGYVSGVLADITLLDESESDFEKEQFVFDFICDGVLKPINLKVWTGTKLNPEKYNDGKNTDYNKLTKICIQLGLVTEKSLVESLKNGEDPDIELEVLKGLQVKFKTTKSIKSKGLSQIDLSTLQEIKNDSTSTK